MAAACCLGLFAPLARGAPDEIQVYTDEISKPGERGLEFHVNHVPSGRSSPTYQGEQASAKRLQLTPEFTWGLSRSLELGLYLPVARDGGGQWVGNGLRGRIKYLVPRAEDQSFFWGLNGEYGWSSRRVSESATSLEVRPIVGWRNDRWLLVTNPIVHFDLGTRPAQKPTFEPAVKIGAQLGPSNLVGLESYFDLGAVGSTTPPKGRPSTQYVSWDTSFGGVDMNLGVGRGNRSAEDRWVLKAIFGFEFR